MLALASASALAARTNKPEPALQQTLTHRRHRQFQLWLTRCTPCHHRVLCRQTHRDLSPHPLVSVVIIIHLLVVYLLNNIIVVGLILVGSVLVLGD